MVKKKPDLCVLHKQVGLFVALLHKAFSRLCRKNGSLSLRRART